MKINTVILEKFLRRAWSRSTSADSVNWSFENPAYGQCAITAVLLSELFNMQIKKVWLDDENWNHYFNYDASSGYTYDLTQSQFAGKVINYNHGESVTIDYILNSEGAKAHKTKERYEILKKNFIYYMTKGLGIIS